VCCISYCSKCYELLADSRCMCWYDFVILVVKVCTVTDLSTTFPEVCSVLQVGHLLSRVAAAESRDSRNGAQ